MRFYRDKDIYFSCDNTEWIHISVRFETLLFSRTLCKLVVIDEKPKLKKWNAIGNDIEVKNL